MSPPFEVAMIGPSEALFRSFNERRDVADLRLRPDLPGSRFDLAPEVVASFPRRRTLSLRYATAK